jgi:hypothetical protein
MRKKFLLPILTVWLSGFLWVLWADEVEDVKIEVQKLKEKITELNNKLVLKQNNDFGKGFSIGMPVGFYNEDWVVGIDCGYTFRKNYGLRFDIQLLGDKNSEGVLLVAMPSVGFISKSPCISNFQIYGGYFVGITQELNQQRNGPYLQFKGFGGIEFFISQKQTFFIEAGGGGATVGKNISYTRGVLLTAGSRFHF